MTPFPLEGFESARKRKVYVRVNKQIRALPLSNLRRELFCHRRNCQSLIRAYFFLPEMKNAMCGVSRN